MTILHVKSYANIKRFRSTLVIRFVCFFLCMYVCKHVLGHNFEARFLIFFPIILSGIRIEKDRISTKSIAF